MKKAFALLLAFAIMLTACACNVSSDKSGTNTQPDNSSLADTSDKTDSSDIVLSNQTSNSEAVDDEPVDPPSPERVVAAYVETNRYEILNEKENYFVVSAGYTCESSIKAVGRGFVIDLKINELDGLSRDKKDALQAAYNEMKETTNKMLQDYRTELPELTYFKVNICEKDGDILAVIKAGKS